ncbi:MAG: glycosyltransferase family 2 protein [Tannerellaceae bacterium]|nr:glycosyltransferase family 2 protein [Tannerellaceae bacterium]
MICIAESTGAGMIYADYCERNDNELIPHPLIDYRKGSLRDDFDFGPLHLYKTTAFKEAVEAMTEVFSYAALYDLRLKISLQHPVIHINEYLYTVDRKAYSSHDKQFEYVDPKNRIVQMEMERACTEHLKRIGAYQPPIFAPIDLSCKTFYYEASIVIPVRNRVNTIGEAIRSALSQQTDFDYNVIVVDNHSTDGTCDEIRRHCSDHRLIHIVPEEIDLGIGGCWNEAIMNSACGKFAVQLDSDDRYSSTKSLQKIVDAFYETHAPMIIGTYQMTDINWNPIPPGLIDHREWTDDNGRNNALRINGLGAPRAFFTPLVRQIKFPNTSYGEDYAMGLRISRDFKIGRIYEVLYDCRRWDGNSDTKLSLHKANKYNTYKDNLRTWELEARIRKNRHDNERVD